MSLANGANSFANAVYTYDAIGRIATTGNNSDTVTYTYAPGTNRIASTGWQTAEVNTANTYDQFKRLTNIAVNGGNVYGYTLNDKNQRTSATLANGKNWTFEYDDLGQLTGAVFKFNELAEKTLNYGYDQIGNRTTATENSVVTNYTSNIINQYTAINQTQPTYDADGNMLTNGDWSYTWNGENRLTKAENSVSGVRIEADYDYMGRRIFKKIYNNNTLTTHRKFAYDGFKLIAEFDALNSDALIANYLWQVTGMDVPLMRSANGVNDYYIVDGNKNVIELRNSSGAVTKSYAYSPFGVLENPIAGDENPFQFSSEYTDPETGLVYYNYRYYSPVLGRWLKPDPIGEQGGVNFYGINDNNIINKYDCLGLCNKCGAIEAIALYKNLQDEYARLGNDMSNLVKKVGNIDTKDFRILQARLEELDKQLKENEPFACCDGIKMKRGESCCGGKIHKESDILGVESELRKIIKNTVGDEPWGLDQYFRKNIYGNWDWQCWDQADRFQKIVMYKLKGKKEFVVFSLEKTFLLFIQQHYALRISSKCHSSYNYEPYFDFIVDPLFWNFSMSDSLLDWSRTPFITMLNNSSKACEDYLKRYQR